jgi:hydroxymethylpyrimidine/phosphomethylpyrimidine kinase
VTTIAMTIAGSDSGGGAGIQADLKTFSALGVYGASVITAVTAQNTLAVTAIQKIDTDVIGAQIDAVLNDLSVNAIKIGMLSSPEIIQTVADHLQGFDGPVVLDPVMVAKSGDALLQADAISALIEALLPLATILTPNLPEAARLLGQAEISDPNRMQSQGKALMGLGAKAVLMKGGHAKGDVCTDILILPSHSISLTAPRLPTTNTHGTGCTLSSAIAAHLALGKGLESAVRDAHTYLQGAIANADMLHIGSGHGPVHHFNRMWG